MSTEAKATESRRAALLASARRERHRLNVCNGVLIGLFLVLLSYAVHTYLM